VSESVRPSSSAARLVVAGLVLCVLLAGTWWFLADRDTWPRGEALQVALRPLVDKQNSDQSLVAQAILNNYLETRANASRWSGIYWGCTFVAAALSALAALILKLETVIQNEGAKKDLAALFAVVAALLITISTSGDFQRKWQANRIAAAELEKTGYDFLEKDTVEARSYLASVGQILLKRHMAIVGSTEQRKPSQEPARPTPQGK